MAHLPPDEARRSLAYPESPEMTGRIDLSLNLVSAPGDPDADADGGTESTIAFSVETEPVVMDRRLSKAGDYLTGNEIARGGMGRIFTADDDFLDRAVALKVSTVKGAREDAQFLGEARVLAPLPLMEART